jgi:GT2 family glycosyltransferase
VDKNSIIIVTYNAMPWLSKCLESTKPYAVVVVDNNSTDETVNFIKANYPEITLLPQCKNLGFGKANNIGISYALKQGADYVLLLNQDAYLIGDCLNQLVTIHKKNPLYGILSPIHLNGNGSLLDYNFKNFITRSKTTIIDDLMMKNHLLPQILDSEFVNAACWLVSKECLIKVGGFNPYFFQYGEDRDYANRVIYHNYKIGIVSNVFVKHDREQGDSKNKNDIINRLLIEVNLLDLNSNKSVDQFLYKLRNKIIKSLLRFNFKVLNKDIEFYFYFKNKKTEINQYNSELKTKKKYLFIDQ